MSAANLFLKDESDLLFENFLWNRVPKVHTIGHETIFHVVYTWLWQAKVARNVWKLVICFFTFV